MKKSNSWLVIITVICVILIDGKEFRNLTLITALGIDIGGSKHLLSLWPSATENSEVCGQLLDELIERGLLQLRFPAKIANEL